MKDHWNANLYNQKHAFVFEYGKGLIELLQPQAQERILDLGCGAGQLTYQISQLAEEAVGIDKSAEMIKSAKAQFPAIEFRVADASNFHFEQPFDAIFSNATLHWVLEYRKAIQCIYDNLKPGGRMVVEFGGKDNIGQIVKELKAVLVQYGYEAQSKIELWYFPSIGAYASALEQVGFRVTFAQHYDRPTELADEKTGIKDWLSMFGQTFFEGVKKEDIEPIKSSIQQNLRPLLFKNGKWYADYKRIRLIAFKY